MSQPFTSGKYAIALCDRCNVQTKLRELKQLTINLKPSGLYVCKSCWEPDHPQLQLGRYPIVDPQAVRNPRPDNSYVQSGLLASGQNGMGSRDIGWGWNPVGGNMAAAATAVGTVKVVIS